MHTVLHGEYFLTLNKLYKTLFVNLFFVRIDPVPLSLVVSDISRMLGRNIQHARLQQFVSLVLCLMFTTKQTCYTIF